MSTPAVEPSKISQFCNKLGEGIQKAATFAKEQGTKAAAAMRDLAKKIAEYVGPQLKKSKEFVLEYSKTHKDQIIPAVVGAAISAVLVGIIAKFCCNPNNGNPNNPNTYARL